MHTLKDLNACLFVAFKGGLFLAHGLNASEERKSATWYDTFGDRRLGRAYGIVDSLLL